MLEIKNLSKKYRDTHILKDLSLTLTPGTVTVLLGPSGVGKSTLLRILNHLETPDSGTVLYNGEPLDFDTIHQKHLIGMVFQNFSLFSHLTTLQNITVVLEKVLNMSQAAATTQAHALLSRFGLDALANLSISRLSGGQQQRLAIARALAVNPHILCLDEPTSALDPLLTRQVATTIHDLAQADYAILLTTHDMSLIGHLNCTVHLMRAGSIIESASSSQLAEHPENFPKIQSFMTA